MTGLLLGGITAVIFLILVVLVLTIMDIPVLPPASPARAPGRHARLRARGHAADDEWLRDVQEIHAQQHMENLPAVYAVVEGENGPGLATLAEARERPGELAMPLPPEDTHGEEVPAGILSYSGPDLSPEQLHDFGRSLAGHYDEPDHDDRCLSCGAETGHYNGCIEDPDAMCLCHLCMDDQAVTTEAACPYHGSTGEPEPAALTEAQRPGPEALPPVLTPVPTCTCLDPATFGHLLCGHGDPLFATSEDRWGDSLLNVALTPAVLAQMDKEAAR